MKESTKLPAYVCIGSHSHMKLCGKRYTTRGWNLPTKNIEERNGKLYVVNFMEHVNGSEIVEISKKVYTEEQE